MNEVKAKLLKEIEDNIDRRGHHVTMVAGGAVPRFAYTIGLSRRYGFELIIGGCYFYLANQVGLIVNQIAESPQLGTTFIAGGFTVETDLGLFRLDPVHDSWSKRLILGALDYYQQDQVPCLQIVPSDDHRTIDVPTMLSAWDSEAEPVWKWLYEPWNFSVAEGSLAITNLQALQGEKIVEAMRWEEHEWELFSREGDEIARSDVRQVCLGMLLATDASLIPITHLGIGEGIWRESAETTWNAWK